MWAVRGAGRMLMTRFYSDEIETSKAGRLAPGHSRSSAIDDDARDQLRRSWKEPLPPPLPERCTDCEFPRSLM